MHKALSPTQPHGTDRNKWKLAWVLLHWRWLDEWHYRLTDSYNFLVSWNLTWDTKTCWVSYQSILSILPVPVKTRNHLNIVTVLFWSSWCAAPFGTFEILLFLPWAIKMTTTVQVITERKTLFLFIHLKNHHQK